MRWASLVIVCLASLMLAGAALARAKTVIINPPGSAGANEYSEVIPSSSGNVSPPSVDGGSSHVAPGGLASIGHGRVGVARLQALGNQGHAAAALAAATAPSRAPGAPAGTGSSRSSAPPAPADTPGSAASGLAHVLTGSDAGGLGVLLPLLLATALVGAVGLVLARARRATQPPA